jgi:SAM-dependent methyltransferase
MYQKIAHFYDLFDVDDASTLWHADFLANYSSADAHVLDIGAGNARAAMLLAERGAYVTCVEPSESMRMIALGRIADDSTYDARLTVLPGDLQTLALDMRFDLAAACHVLYLLPEDVLATGLDRLRAHLAPGARLIGDFALAAGRQAKPRGLAAARTIGAVDYRKFTTSLPDGPDRWHVTWAFEAWHRDMLIEHLEESFTVYVRDAAACRTLLAAHGFKIEAEFGDYGRAPWRDDAEAGRYVFVAT